MKYLILFLITFNISQASVTGVTEGCPSKAQFVANEGDKFVTIKFMGEDQKLMSVSGEPFSLQAKNPVVFRNKNMEFEMTSVVMSSLPRLKWGSGVTEKKCMVNLWAK